MRTVKQQQGFTLVELIIVIVILGILAVTAAPKFLNLQKDAQESALTGVQGAINGAMSIVYGKAVIAGKHTAATATISVEGGTENLVYGYPKATEADLELVTDLNLNANGTAGDFDVTVDGTDVYIFPNGSADPKAASDAGTCYVKYSEATSTTAKATVSVVTTGC